MRRLEPWKDLTWDERVARVVLVLGGIGLGPVLLAGTRFRPLIPEWVLDSSIFVTAMLAGYGSSFFFGVVVAAVVLGAVLAWQTSDAPRPVRAVAIGWGFLSAGYIGAIAVGAWVMFKFATATPLAFRAGFLLGFSVTAIIVIRSFREKHGDP